MQTKNANPSFFPFYVAPFKPRVSEGLGAEAVEAVTNRIRATKNSAQLAAQVDQFEQTAMARVYQFRTASWDDLVQSKCSEKLTHLLEFEKHPDIKAIRDCLRSWGPWKSIEIQVLAYRDAPRFFRSLVLTPEGFRIVSGGYRLFTVSDALSSKSFLSKSVQVNTLLLHVDVASVKEALLKATSQLQRIAESGLRPTEWPEIGEQPLLEKTPLEVGYYTTRSGNYLSSHYPVREPGMPVDWMTDPKDFVGRAI